jgi:ParB-like chromosome segregation protein Spo0J
MKEWGWTNPVLADESGGVIAGRAGILAARQLGYGEVPVMVARGWTDAQKRAYVIADNQLALNAGWDLELLGLELGDLLADRTQPRRCASGWYKIDASSPLRHAPDACDGTESHQ